MSEEETTEINEMVIKCPACAVEGIATSIMKEIEIPHFGKVLETTIQCKKCGFKHSDVIALEHNDPARYTLKISKETLSVRVVRSQSATVTIPELGVKVEPGPKSEGYVSNIEGVITRFIDATLKALKLFTDDEAQKNANAVLEKLEGLLSGEAETLLLIEDPFGQSQIMDVNAKTEPLTQEELKHLRTGFVIIDDDDEDLDEMEDE